MNTSSFEVAVLLVNWNGREHLKTCLEHLHRQSNPGCKWQIWVFDNGSRDGSQAWLREKYPQVHLLESDHNLGFAEAVNRLVAAVDVQAVVFLNNDTAPREDWLAHLVASIRQAPEDVAAIAGMTLDWEGEHIDFVGGSMTFDGHAFQSHAGQSVQNHIIPDSGTPLLFANGANMLIRREAFLASGGFDKEFFAYFEDVDLGWRLWAQGHRITFEAKAVVHHRAQATSSRLGLFNRGLLFERNAFLNAYKNFDESHWQSMMPAILLTLMHRTQTLLEQKNPGAKKLTEIPFLPREHPMGFLRKWRARVGQFLRESQLPGAGTMRQLSASITSRLPFFLAEVHLNDPWTISQFRAVHGVFQLLDLYADRRQQVQGLRVRSDEEIFKLFPLQIVPTYPGDENFFQSKAFKNALSKGIPFV